MSRATNLDMIGLLDEARSFVLNVNTRAASTTPDDTSDWLLLELIEIELKTLMKERLASFITREGMVRVRMDLDLAIAEHGDSLASELATRLRDLADRIAEQGESDLVIRDDHDAPIGILLMDGGRP